MKKRLSIIVALVMALTIFCIPGQSVFAEPGTYTITFNSNGGTGNMEPQVVQVEEFGQEVTATLEENKFEKEGSVFEVWSDPDGKEYGNGAEITLTGDVTLTAHWKEAEEPPEEITVGSITVNRSCTKDTVTLSWNVSGDVDKVVVKFNGKNYTITSGTSQKIAGLKGSTEYSYTVTPYYKEKVGAAVSGKIRTDGPVMSGGYEYYYKNGAMVKDGIVSFTDTRFGTNKYNLNHYYDASGKFVGRRAYMYNKIKNQTSKKYLICIDRTNNVMCVYIGGKGKWRPYKYWSCVTGRMKKGNYHPTPLGTYKIKSRKRTFSGYGDEKKKINKYSVWYCSRFTGSVFIHSQLYKYKSKSKFIPGGGAMGSNKSHGCVRLFKDYSYWIYKNCAKGTKVIVIQ